MDEVEYEYRRNRHNDFEYDVFLICPVRSVDPKVKATIEAYVAKLEREGKRVYYPARDTNQVDENGYRICTDNARAIEKSKEVHIYFDPDSKGSLFDMGVAFALCKSLTIVNPEDVPHTKEKSINNVLLRWNDLSLE